MQNQKLLDLRQKTEILSTINHKDLIDKNLIPFLVNELKYILTNDGKKFLLEFEISFKKNQIFDEDMFKSLKNNPILYKSIISYIYWRHTQTKKQIHIKDDIDRYIFNNLKDNPILYKSIIDYITWENTKINNFLNINVPTLKKIFKIKSNNNIKNIINPLKYNIKCTCCNNTGLISIYSTYDYDKEFYCNSCGHKDRYNSNQKFEHTYIYCSCQICNEMKNIIINNAKTWSNNLFNMCQDYINNSPEKKGLISDNEMRIDFEISRSNYYDKDLRELFSFHPQNIDELFNIIDKKEKSLKKFKKNKNFKKNITKKLLENKVIYKYYKKRDIAQEGLFVYILTSQNYDYKNLYIEIFTTFNSDIAHSENFFANYGPSTNTYCLHLNNCNYIGFKIFNSIDKNYYSFDNYVYTEKYIENPYFFNFKNKPNNPIKFNSLAEENIYPILCKDYGQNNIKCNQHLSEYLNISKLENFLNKKWIPYLETCIVDFVILKNGSILKVIELQKGNHHNELDWINKDLIKKLACTICNIEFEEYF